MEAKILTIRKGINGFEFSICSEEGKWLGNFHTIEDIREYYGQDVKDKRVVLKKQTRMLPIDADSHKPVKKPGKIYAYCRISRKEQSIDRQIRNIQKEYPDAHIVKEAFSGRYMDRPEWSKLYEKAAAGDIIVFDSVSRMSRSAEDGVETYFTLFERGVQLVFLKEHYIDTAVYEENLHDRLELTGADEDEIFKGLNNYFRKLAEKQIRIAFEQAEKEVADLRQRTREGIETARLNGKQIGQKSGNKLHIKKKAPAMEQIRKYSRDFEGKLTDAECMKLIGISRNTYYKYKREMRMHK